MLRIFIIVLLILFTAYEALAGFVYWTSDADAMNKTVQGLNMTDESMRITRGFGSAIWMMVILAIWVQFIKDRSAKLMVFTAFAFYNACVAYLSFNPGFETPSMGLPAYIHSTFAVLFIVAIASISRSNHA